MAGYRASPLTGPGEPALQPCSPRAAGVRRAGLLCWVPGSFARLLDAPDSARAVLPPALPTQDLGGFYYLFRLLSIYCRLASASGMGRWQGRKKGVGGTVNSFPGVSVDSLLPWRSPGFLWVLTGRTASSTGTRVRQTRELVSQPDSDLGTVQGQSCRLDVLPQNLSLVVEPQL